MIAVRNRSWMGRASGVAAGVALAAGAALVGGCADLGQIGVVEARKSFRIAIEAVEVDAPVPELDAILDDEVMADLLLEAGASPEDLAQLRAADVALTDLDAVARVIPIAPLRDDLEATIVESLRAELDAAARDALGDGVLSFESDWSAWDAWRIDLEHPDASIAEALEGLPIVLRLVMEVESLSELVDGIDEGDAAGAAQDVEDAAELDFLETLFLREIGLRTLAPEEIEPDAGWDDATREAAETALRDPALVAACPAGRPPLDPTLAARLSVQSMADPLVFATLAEAEVPDSEVCGVHLVGDPTANLKTYLEDGMRLVVALETTLGVDDFVLGGYLDAGVVGRIRLPGTVQDVVASF